MRTADSTLKSSSNNYAEWKSTLGLYKDELAIFKNRITEVAGKYTDMEVMKQIEHFQNQLLIQTENVDTLKHDINENLKLMAGEMHEKAGHVSQEQISANARLEERFESQKMVFNDLKNELMQFLSKTM